MREDLLAEKGLTVSRRTLQRAVQPYRQALKAEALATMRFETPPGRQLQIDFGERLVEIGGAKIKAFVFVATSTLSLLPVTRSASTQNPARLRIVDSALSFPPLPGSCSTTIL